MDVFNSGITLKKKLDMIEPKKGKELELLPKNQLSALLTTFSEKHSYFEKVKPHNFKESMRLEGYFINIEDFPLEKSAQTGLREELIKKYSQYKNVNNANG